MWKSNLEKDSLLSLTEPLFHVEACHCSGSPAAICEASNDEHLILFANVCMHKMMSYECKIQKLNKLCIYTFLADFLVFFIQYLNIPHHSIISFSLFKYLSPWLPYFCITQLWNLVLSYKIYNYKADIVCKGLLLKKGCGFVKNKFIENVFLYKYYCIIALLSVIHNM